MGEHPPLRRFQVTLSDGAVLSGSESGSGAPVLMVSGLGGSEAFWTPVRQALPGYRCIAFDQRGIGASTRGSARVSVAQLAEDCREVLAALACGPVHAIGHSTGGCIVQQLAITQAGSVRSMLLGATWAAPNPYMNALFRLREEVLLRSPSAYERLGVVLSYPADWLAQHMTRMTPPAQDWSEARVQIVRERIEALLAHDAVAALAQLRMPCLVVGARDDQVVPLHLQQMLAAVMPGARLRTLTEGGHFFPVSALPHYLDILNQWLGAQCA